ncbi:MAG: RdgB/HAM1 family non-canonical purine NTP pyrophosphatase [Treponema sp.]|jgi:XTP/dITP diphosphohydrolase|nr:RdgB/HAM1 family non-canonical purine NTP pyrophosphatase [Treponema sp.]
MTVWFATGNIHKKEELAGLLSCPELKIPSEAGLTFEPEETGNTFLENALIKAEALQRLCARHLPDVWHPGQPVIADDSGICVDALGGRPGIYSARYGDTEIDNQGVSRRLSFEEKNKLLLSEIRDNPQRSARFVCAMVLYFSPNRFFIAQETVEGELVRETPRGSGGFGYDPIFFIPELGCTAAELSEEEKNRISHRGKAGRAIAKILSELHE